MAVLYVSEFDDHGDSETDVLRAAALANQTVTIAASANSSSTFNAGTGLVLVHTDTTCFVLFGTAPVATVTSSRMATNGERVYAVPKGRSFKVSVISA